MLATQQEPDLTPNEVLIEQFTDSLPMLSKKRVDKYRNALLHVSEWWLEGKSFDHVTRSDIRTVLQGIEHATDHRDNAKRKGRPFAEWTKTDYRRSFKKFLRWRFPHRVELVQDIKTGSPAPTVGPDDIFTEEELSRVYQACISLRDRTMSMTLYELGCRPHEFLGMRKSDVMFDEYGAIAYIRPVSNTTGEARHAKTGPRRVRVINAAPLLANWIENHPIRERDAPLWANLSNNKTYSTALRWLGLNKAIKRWARAAGVEKKRISPYIFRHTRLTHLAKVLTESQLCIFAGWSIGSKMSRTYIHLSGRDVDETLLRAYGIKKTEDLKAKVIATPRKCPRCETMNPAQGQMCVKCGFALSLEAALSAESEIASKFAHELIERGLDQGLINDVLAKLYPKPRKNNPG